MILASNEASHDEQNEILAGTITRKVYFSSDTNFVVFRLKTAAYNNEITCIGHLPPFLTDAFDLDDDLSVELEGKWKTTRYGRQFAFSRISLAGEEDEFHFFLKLIKGLGPKIIENVKKHFSKAELISILETDPQKLLIVPGIGPKKLETIVSSWKDARKFRNLYAFFERTGAAASVSTSLVIKIYKHFENKNQDPVAAITENPYCLTEIHGIGFKTADRIALSLGISPDDERRIVSGTFYVLKKTAETEGHTFLYHDQFRKRFFDELHLDSDMDSVPEKVNRLLDSILASPPQAIFSDGNRVALKRFFILEDEIKNILIRKHITPMPDCFSLEDQEIDDLISEAEGKLGFPLTTHQRNFLRSVLSMKSSLAVLAGYAGTGKTTVLKALLDCLLSSGLFSPQEIACCAFTGMAARRIREVTGFPYCYTIHSLLEFSHGRFQRDFSNPLDQTVVILDEASMVNVDLFYSLLSALKRNTLLVLVGDPAQLPPIGPGNIFADLIGTGLVPYTELTEIKRQSPDSAITLIANEVRNGIFPKDYIYNPWKDFSWIPVRTESIFMAKRKGASGKELDLIRRENYEKILSSLLELVRELKDRGVTQRDLQVLSPMRSTPLGTDSLNRELQAIYNHPTPDKQEVFFRDMVFRQGDKVVNLENRDLPVVSTTVFLNSSDPDRLSTTSKRILNGQLGELLAFLPETEQLAVRMWDVDDYVVFFDKRDIGQKIDLAYALTVHKAQGSQYPFVIIPLVGGHWFMLNNQWLYTALTRAYRHCWVVGEHFAFKRAATNTESVERQTWLSLLGEEGGNLP